MTGCLSEKSQEITAAEVQATQAAIERRNSLDQKTHEVQMALVWPKMIAWSFVLPIATLGSLMILKKIADQWIVEREIKLQESVARLKRVEVRKEERKLNPPTGGTNVQPSGTGDWPDRNQPIISSAQKNEFNDIIKIAETKLK